VADASFCTGVDFIVYARGRGIYANVFDLGLDADGTALTHWGFFHEEPLPPSRQEQCLPVGHRYQTSSQEVSNRIGRARRPDPGPAVRRIATA